MQISEKYDSIITMLSLCTSHTGVFEHTAVHHVNNGSGHHINRFDAPFGSIRDSTLTDMVMTDKSTNSTVLYEQSALGEYSTSPTKIKLEDTLGYSMFGQDLPSPKGGEPFPKPSGLSHTIAMNGCRLAPNLWVSKQTNSLDCPEIIILLV